MFIKLNQPITPPRKSQLSKLNIEPQNLQKVTFPKLELTHNHMEKKKKKKKTHSVNLVYFRKNEKSDTRTHQQRQREWIGTCRSALVADRCAWIRMLGSVLGSEFFSPCLDRSSERSEKCWNREEFQRRL
ncbi:hypothetical protein ACB098_09G015400 [Castanea mollissima]